VTYMQYMPQSCKKKTMSLNYTATISINYTTMDIKAIDSRMD